MIGFKCQCGRALYFESTRCEACGSTVGFDPLSLTFKTLEDEEAASPYQQCSNGANTAYVTGLQREKRSAAFVSPANSIDSYPIYLIQEIFGDGEN